MNLMQFENIGWLIKFDGQKIVKFLYISEKYVIESVNS